MRCKDERSSISDPRLPLLLMTAHAGNASRPHAHSRATLRTATCRLVVSEQQCSICPSPLRAPSGAPPAATCGAGAHLVKGLQAWRGLGTTSAPVPCPLGPQQPWAVAGAAERSVVRGPISHHAPCRCLRLIWPARVACPGPDLFLSPSLILQQGWSSLCACVWLSILCSALLFVHIPLVHRTSSSCGVPSGV